MAEHDLDMSDALIREREEGRAEGKQEARRSHAQRSRAATTQHRRRTQLSAAQSERQASRERQQASRERAQYNRLIGAAANTSQRTQPPAPARATSSGSRGIRLPANTGPAPAISAPLVIELGIITSDELVNNHRLPLPSRLLVAFGIFGGLSLFRGNAARPANVFAWALVLATFYSSARGSGNAPPALAALDALGNFMSGNYSTKGSTTTPPTAVGSGQTETTAGASLRNGLNVGNGGTLRRS